MTQRDGKGRFIKGTTGNPGGRPRKADELRSLLEGDAKDVARKVIEAAKGGDMQACRIVVERILPPVRPAHACVAFDFDADASLTDQSRQILAAVAEGKLPPDQGKALLDGIAALSRVTEMDELARRIAAIEEQSNA
ncbi:DUF5681 domain-containing protein [Billgrantia sp. LNSP4103-1]|uniref:DUF5681 domain-containing protein n=1 Tax=Billgrantia sp. LNSP4103-1 TaxID=3410266 RepID=UPI00403F18C7